MPSFSKTDYEETKEILQTVSHFIFCLNYYNDPGDRKWNIEAVYDRIGINQGETHLSNVTQYHTQPL